jgi:hypothetical protein
MKYSQKKISFFLSSRFKMTTMKMELVQQRKEGGGRDVNGRHEERQKERYIGENKQLGFVISLMLLPFVYRLFASAIGCVVVILQLFPLLKVATP